MQGFNERRSAVMVVIAAGLAVSVSTLAMDDVVIGGEPGQAVVNPRVLDLKAGRIDTTTLPNLLTPETVFDGDRRYVIQLDGPMTPARKFALDAVGARLGDYLPEFSYIARLDGVSPAALAAAGFVVWAGDFRDEWKLDPEFGLRVYRTDRRIAMELAGISQIAVVLFDGAGLQPALDAITKVGGQILATNLNGPSWMIDAKVPTGAVRGLVASPAIQYIEDAPEGTTRNDSNRWILQSNVSPQTPIWNAGIHGEGQTGGLIDGTPRESHCMFDDSVAPGTPSHRKFVGWHGAGSQDFHGTHTGGTMAGDQAPFGVYTTHDGIAFAAKISFSDLDDVVAAPSTLQPRLQDQHDDGGRVHSNSWGDDGTRNYTTWCRQIDLFNYANEDSVVAFAVSNGGILTTPENAINALGVGASQDSSGQANHCSGGVNPSLDGRRKTEIYAPGCGTTSATSSSACGTGNSTGTSMACPAISGAGLLVRQYYTDGYYPTGIENAANALTPSGALIRATLLNGTVDMTGITGYPSLQEGWGRLLLDNVLHLNGELRKLWVVDIRNASGLGTGGEATYNINILSGGVPLRVTLVWTGPAAAVNAGNPVINNLDLEVTEPSTTLFRGNVFTSGQSSSGGVADLKNNVEVYLKNSPAAGAYSIKVKGTAVNSGLQGYALVVTGDIGTPCTPPSIDTPPASLAVDDGDPAVFSVAATGTGSLFYQWIKDGGDLSDGGNISGASSDTLTINPASAADEGCYSVRVEDDCLDPVESACGSLTINEPPCAVDLDNSAIADVPDIFLFLALWFAQDPAANFDGAGAVDVPDIFAFLAAWFAGCP